MTEAEKWLGEYAGNQQQVERPLVYWPGAFAVIIGLVGLLWSLPVPGAFRAISPVLNWGSTFLLAATVYYFVISVPLAIGMLPFTLGLAALEMRIAHLTLLPSPWASVGLLAAGIAAIWLSKNRESDAGYVWRHLLLVMLGPLWLLSDLYRRLRIPY
jgi:hypothetical protein